MLASVAHDMLFAQAALFFRVGRLTLGGMAAAAAPLSG